MDLQAARLMDGGAWWAAVYGVAQSQTRLKRLSSSSSSSSSRLLSPCRFSRLEYWSALPRPSLRDLPNPGIKPRSPTLQEDSLQTEPPGKPRNTGEGSVQFTSVTQLCPTLCDPMNRSTPGLPVHHQLPEFTQTHVHRVSEAIQPSHPLSSPSSPDPNPSQHQSLFQ